MPKEARLNYQAIRAAFVGSRLVSSLFLSPLDRSRVE
jgi:hypothetical protein